MSEGRDIQRPRVSSIFSTKSRELPFARLEQGSETSENSTSGNDHTSRSRRNTNNGSWGTSTGVVVVGTNGGGRSGASSASGSAGCASTSSSIASSSSTTSASHTRQLRLDGSVEGTSHSSENKLGGEGQVWVTGAVGVLQRGGREADEVATSVFSNGRVDNELDGGRGCDIDRFREGNGLQECLRKKTKLGQARVPPIIYNRR